MPEQIGDRSVGELRAVLDVAESILAELDVEVVLSRVLEAARTLLSARYAALGVLDESRTQLERFITAGIDEETKRSIGNLPQGRGVLGELITNPHPLRLEDVGGHPRSYGFPPGHPPMKTFLGVPPGGRRRPLRQHLSGLDKSNGEPFSSRGRAGPCRCSRRSPASHWTTPVGFALVEAQRSRATAGRGRARCDRSDRACRGRRDEPRRGARAGREARA